MTRRTVQEEQARLRKQRKKAQGFLSIFKKPLHESLTSVLPIMLIVLALGFTIAPVPNNAMMAFLLGGVLLIVGMGLFTLGSEMSMIPLGQAVGNNLEVKEAMEVLQNRGPADVREVATALAGMMISLGRDTTYECGKMLAEEALNKGRAWEKFKTMVENQGGDLSYIEDPDRFDVAAFSREIRAPKAGYITSMQTEQIGVAAGVLGAGREKKDSKVDYSAGILVYKKIGAYVEPGDVMAVLYTNREESLDTAGELYLESVQIDEVKPELPQLIVDIIR